MPDLIMFGGTFDPPHLGHMGCASAVLELFPETKLLVIPALKPAGAAGNHKDPTTEYSKRLRLCELAFECDTNSEAVRDHNRVEVSDIEMTTGTPGEPNYTCDTITKLKETNSGKRLGLLIGDDQLAQFDTWHRPLDILSGADLIVVKRQTKDRTKPSQELQALADATIRRLGFCINWLSDTNMKQGIIDTEGSSQIFLIEETLSDAASSAIRNLLSDGKVPPETWISIPVSNYINENRLYHEKGLGN